MIDDIPQAFIKVQRPGNYTDRTHDESAGCMSTHAPLEGPATGLGASGELQELVFGAHDETAPVSVTQRQLSMSDADRPPQKWYRLNSVVGKTGQPE